MERLISAFEMLEDGPVVTDSLVALCREAPVGGRQAEVAGPRGAALPADLRRDGRSTAEARVRELEAELERRGG